MNPFDYVDDILNAAGQRNPITHPYASLDGAVNALRNTGPTDLMMASNPMLGIVSKLIGGQLPQGSGGAAPGPAPAPLTDQLGNPRLGNAPTMPTTAPVAGPDALAGAYQELGITPEVLAGLTGKQQRMAELAARATANGQSLTTGLTRTGKMISPQMVVDMITGGAVPSGESLGPTQAGLTVDQALASIMVGLNQKAHTGLQAQGTPSGNVSRAGAHFNEVGATMSTDNDVAATGGPESFTRKELQAATDKLARMTEDEYQQEVEETLFAALDAEGTPRPTDPIIIYREMLKLTAFMLATERWEKEHGGP